MRLQTISTRNSGYLGHVSLSRGPRRPPVERHFYVHSKTGHGTVLVDRRQKPQIDRARAAHVKPSDKVSHRHAPVKCKWHISNPRSSHDRSRFAPRKPYAASAALSGTSQRTRSSTHLVPSLVPNRAFPFIKHAEQQAASGLHKPVGLILASAYILGAACQLSGKSAFASTCLRQNIISFLQVTCQASVNLSWETCNLVWQLAAIHVDCIQS